LKRREGGGTRGIRFVVVRFETYYKVFQNRTNVITT
jgi:hypothetical protein